MKAKRINYFDLAKGVGIILVVLGHMENISTGLRTWIASFHMPLFFIISGMLIAVKNEVDVDFTGKNQDVKGLIRKKAKGILVPYLWFSLIYVPIDIVNLLVLDNVDSHTFIQNLLDSVTLSGISVMWFLPALFIAETVALWLIAECGPGISNKLFVKNFKKYEMIIGYVVVFVLSLVIFMFSYEIWTQMKPVYDANAGNYLLCTLLQLVRTILRGICMSYHVIVGFLTYKVIVFLEEKYKKFKNKNDEKKIEKEIRGLSIALAVIFFVLNLSWCFKNGAVDNHFLTLNNLGLYFLCAFFGSMAIVLFCKGQDSIDIINYLGRNSLIIMATHLQCYLLYGGILIAIAIDAYVTRAKSYVYMFNSVLFTMLLEVVVIYVINRFFPFIMGKGSIKDAFKKKQ